MKPSKLNLAEVTELILEGKSLTEISEKFGYKNNTNVSNFLSYKKTSFTKIKNGLHGADLAVNNRKINELQVEYDLATSAGVKAGLKAKINKLRLNQGVKATEPKVDKAKLRAEKKEQKIAKAQAERFEKKKKKAIEKANKEARVKIEKEEKKKQKSLSRALDAAEKTLKKTLKFFEVDYTPHVHKMQSQEKRIRVLEKALLEK